MSRRALEEAIYPPLTRRQTPTIGVPASQAGSDTRASAGLANSVKSINVAHAGHRSLAADPTQSHRQPRWRRCSYPLRTKTTCERISSHTDSVPSPW